MWATIPGYDEDECLTMDETQKVAWAQGVCKTAETEIKCQEKSASCVWGEEMVDRPATSATHHPPTAQPTTPKPTPKTKKPTMAKTKRPSMAPTLKATRKATRKA